MNEKLKDINACVIIPTYNNEKTLIEVLEGVLHFTQNKNELIVVNDGSTDATLELLQPFLNQITLISYKKNKGKGYALKQGFNKAVELGFDNAITIDSDGQHFPDDLPVFIKEAKKNKGALLMGSRDMSHESVPGKSSFGNKFSNFWFKLETGIELPDTQTGYRLYPLAPLKQINLFTNKFETEIEIIVKMAWKGVKIIPVKIKVLYDYENRVSHFRPFKDFTRISLLNTYFVILTFVWHLPKRIFKAALKKEFWQKVKHEIIQPEESNLKKALSIGFGFFMGIVPIWGFQLLIGIPLAILFNLNKVLFILAANISIPPMIPFIIWLSYYFGGLLLKSHKVLPDVSNITLETIKLDILQYTLGAVFLAIMAGVMSFFISLALLNIFRKKYKNI